MNIFLLDPSYITFHSKKKLVCMVLVLHLKTSRAAISHIYTQSFQSRPCHFSPQHNSTAHVRKSAVALKTTCTLRMMVTGCARQARSGTKVALAALGCDQMCHCHNMHGHGELYALTADRHGTKGSTESHLGCNTVMRSWIKVVG